MFASGISMAALISLFFCTAMLTIVPIIVVVVLCLKKLISPLPLAVGAAAFFISQILLRIPLMQVLNTQLWFTDGIQTMGTVLRIVIFGGLTAGLFEETARLVACKYPLNKRRSYRDAMAFGLGHGLCEVVLLVGLSFVSSLMMAMVQMLGGYDALVAMVGPMADVVAAQLQGLTAADLLLGFAERIFAVIFHIFATLLIFKGVQLGKGFVNWGLAVLAHTAFNAIAVLLAQYIGLWQAEGALLLCAVPMLWYIVRQRSRWPACAGAATGVAAGVADRLEPPVE